MTTGWAGVIARVKCFENDHGEVLEADQEIPNLLCRGFRGHPRGSNVFAET